MPKTLDKCPVCYNPIGRYAERFHDAGTHYFICECSDPECLFYFLNPQASISEIVSLENNHIKEKFTLPAQKKIAQEICNHSYIVNIVNPWIKERGNVVEIGPGYGYALAALKKAGYSVTGVELSSYRGEVIKTISGAPVVDSLGKLDSSISISGFIMWHVLEHITDPVDFLKNIHALSNDKTYLLIQVPSFENLDYYYKDPNNYNSMFTKVHVNYFTRYSLTMLLRKSGFMIADLKIDKNYNFLTVVAKPDKCNYHFGLYDNLIKRYFGKLKNELVITIKDNQLYVSEFIFDIYGDELQFSDGPKLFIDEYKNKNIFFLTWEAIAYIKVNHIGRDIVVEKAKTGEIYDEDYYTGRGAGSPYIGYPNQFYDNNPVENFLSLSKEIESIHNKNCKILDLGCATGIFVDILQRAGFEAYGIDLSKYAIENGICKNLYQMNALDIDFPDNYFDLIISQDFLEHIEMSNLHRVFDEQIRIAKPSAQLIHFIPFYDTDHPYECDVHLTNANRDWWIDLILSHKGLRTIQLPEEGYQWENSNGILKKYFILEVK
ncbi:methyltransferase domain-containing protein [Thermodesulfobacteriota bacterium]